MFLFNFKPGLFLVIFAALAVTSIASASDFYVAQAALGAFNGTDAGNAYSVAFFNSAANWSSPIKVPGKIGPGDTVHLVGAITTALAIQASGTPGLPITILFEPGATMSVPAWSSKGAISMSHRKYITINGDARGGRQGIIENTNNGTELGNQINSVGISGNNCSYITVKNLTVRNIYVRVTGGDQKGYGICIFSYFGGGSPAMNNWLVTNCALHDAYCGFDFSYPTGSGNVEYSHCEAYNCNWGGGCGSSGGTSTCSNVLVHDNRFYNWENWDDTASNRFHHNGFFAFAASGASLSRVRYYNNVVGPNYTTGASGNHSTSGLFIQADVYDVMIYNNLFLANRSDNPSSGFIYLNPSAEITSIYRVFNNTFLGGGDGIGINFSPRATGHGTQKFVAENNLATNLTFISIFNNATALPTIDYNLGYHLKGARGGQGYSNSSGTSSGFASFTRWQKQGFDAHGTDSNPNLNSDGRPQPPSGAIDAGVNLSAYFTTDLNGVIRPQGAGWDIGALESVPLGRQSDPIRHGKPPSAKLPSPSSRRVLTDVGVFP